MVNFFTLFLQLLLLFNLTITTFQFGVNITMFYEKSLAKRLEQIASVDYQTISHAEIHNLQFFLRSKKLWKIIKKLIAEIHTAQQTLWQTPIIKRGEKRGRKFVLILWRSISHYKDALFRFWKNVLSSLHRQQKSSKHGE